MRRSRRVGSNGGGVVGSSLEREEEEEEAALVEKVDLETGGIGYDMAYADTRTYEDCRRYN